MISLIVATLHRVDQVERLLASLDDQTYKDFELIVVDQNEDDRLLPVFQSHPNLVIRHLRSGRGLSRGRNVALPLAKGDFICFPDDDCWYPKDLLSMVTIWFSLHREFAGLFVCLRDFDDTPVGPRWPKRACLCTRENLWDMGLSASVFLRRDLVDANGPFNENIGVGSGSPYQSGEDIDYNLRPLKRGFKMWFEPSLTVHHSSMHSPVRLRRATYGYALGGAYVQRLHGYSLIYFSNQVIRSLGGATVSFLKGDFENGRIYLIRAAGQLRGYFWGARDLAKQFHSATAK